MYRVVPDGPAVRQDPERADDAPVDLQRQGEHLGVVDPQRAQRLARLDDHRAHARLEQRGVEDLPLVDLLAQCGGAIIGEAVEAELLGMARGDVHEPADRLPALEQAQQEVERERNHV